MLGTVGGYGDGGARSLGGRSCRAEWLGHKDGCAEHAGDELYGKGKCFGQAFENTRGGLEHDITTGA